MKIVEPYVKLASYTPDAEKLIEQLGRLCYKSEDRITQDSAHEFIQMLKGRNHESVLEHASASFVIGTDRGISHELVRHRIASFSQTSTRYCNYSKGKFGGEIGVVRPSQLKEGTPEYKHWLRGCLTAEDCYLSMLPYVTPQVARSVLPTCTFTEIGMTANFREWLHFLKLRTSPAAHPDMQVIARMIAFELQNIAPSVFSK